MKGIRFYEELTDKNRKAEASKGNVIAVAYETRWYNYTPDGYYDTMFECVSALFFEPNSVCCGDGVSQRYLTKDTKRISETRAREIHPALFEYLER